MQILTEPPEGHPVGLLPDPAHGAGPRRLSEILQAVADAPIAPDERIFLGELIDGFGDRAFGALIFIFALPVALPIAIPGISAVLGAPLLLLAWQLMRARSHPWLPDVMRSRSFRRAEFAAILTRILPWLRRLEKLVGPRLCWLTTARTEPVIGGIALVLALILFLPVPFGNSVPAIAIALLALGVLERDGVAVILGTFVGFLGLAIVSGVVFGFVKAALFVVHKLISG